LPKSAAATCPQWVCTGPSASLSWFGFRLTDEALVLVRQNLPQLESLDLTGCDAISDEAKLSLWDARGGGPLQILW
jgi:hypothetical protein